MATFDLTDEERNIALQALWNFKLAHGQLSAGASEQSPEELAVTAQYLDVIDGVAAKLGGKPNALRFSGSTQAQVLRHDNTEATSLLDSVGDPW